VKDLSEIGAKSSHEACTNTTSTPPSNAKSPSFVLDGTEVKINKIGYLTPEKTPFKLGESFEVSPTHLTPTPITDYWFTDDDDQLHCTNLIKNLHEFPVKTSEDWLNKNFRQFKKFVNDNNLNRVKVLTNLWLHDGKQHSFPISTPEDNTLPSERPG